jgi:hypothetical protein
MEPQVLKSANVDMNQTLNEQHVKLVLLEHFHQMELHVNLV